MTTYNYDSLNRIWVVTATTSDTYDLLNQMITSTTADGLVITYVYNGEGLRV